MDAVEDYYQLLGVSRSVTQDALKRAFRSQIVRAHPDCHSDDDSAHERARKLIDAYKVLSDEQSRAHYDTTLTNIVSVPSKAEYSRCSAYSPAITRAVAAVVVMLLTLYMAFVIAREVDANHGPVFRPFLAGLQYLHPDRKIPVIVDPTLSDSLEWYQAQRYQFSLAHRYAATEMIDTYSEAARLASVRGDHTRAEFYRDQVRENRDAQETWSM